ncbi:MAG: hypothetical protein AAF503_03510 [Pseudomonadota bacterium]
MNAEIEIAQPPAKRRKGRKALRKTSQQLPVPKRVLKAVRSVPKRRRAWPLALSFLVAVLAPAAIAAWYMAEIAADQYQSHLAFSVRSGTSQQALPAPDLLGAMSGGHSPVLSTESYVIYDFLRSQQIVEEVNAEIDLREVFNRAPGDWVFSLGADASTEDLVRYWHWQVPVVYDTLSGIVTVEVRSFDRDSATRIARAILTHATGLVNDISRAAREDTVGFAQRELKVAEARLQTIRSRIRAFRDVEQKANAENQIAIAMGLIATLEGELAKARVDRKVALSYTKPTDPRVQRLENRITVLESRIQEERRRFGKGTEAAAGTDKSLADLMGDFEELEVEREFAQTAYTNALASLQTAKADARRTQRYLAVHVRPTQADEAQYPQRLLIVGLVFGGALVIWILSVLILANIRDRV